MAEEVGCRKYMGVQTSLSKEGLDCLKVSQIGEKVEWKKMGFIRVGEGAPSAEGESQEQRGEVCSGKGESDDGGCI